MKRLLLNFVSFSIFLLATHASAFSNFKMACNHFPPLKIKDSPLKPGIDVELITEIFSGLNKKIEYSFLPWKRALVSAEKGDYLGLCSCSYTVNREKKFVYTDEIGKSSIGIYFNKKNKNIKSIKGLKGRVVGVVRGYNLENEIKQKGIKVISMLDNLGLIKMLKAKRVDAIFSYERPIKYILNNKKIENDFVYIETRVSPYYTCFSIKNKNSTELVKKFNKELKTIIKDGRYKKIIDKYQLK